MKIFLRVVLVAIVLLVAAAAAIYFTGSVPAVIGMIGRPHHGWDMSFKAPAPDYANANNWAALPANPGLSSLVPKGQPPAVTQSNVDVFFIHPTGYLSGGDWNSPMDPNSTTEENTRWMMANQASTFNGCCLIYAPRYREASIYRYLGAPRDIVKKAAALAYDDVDRAFTYFLENYSKDRPFIIASHSQGTEHGFRLLKERVDGTPLAERLVAAYLIGYNITDKDAAGLKSLHVCGNATDTHCFVHWATWGEGSSPKARTNDKLVCVNPLSWMRDGGMTPAEWNEGAVPLSGTFTPNFFGSDAPRGTVFGSLGAPLKGWTWAACRNGFLIIANQSGTQFDKMDLGGRNYHGLDYPVFAMNIRHNANARIAAFTGRTRPPP
ncbi:MAG TPA: DUF3089 domain-containing protein [Rhizomicrobium sp.]|nr:DUF3089 domain-containing protein [Rhizomicrobium sp.]